ncbi:MAG TPA: PDZ domain-containing protein [Vicinamibacterales bacterium]|nr:PDZ domain-containing protein [Vicinamibacterales bacterium]
MRSTVLALAILLGTPLSARQQAGAAAVVYRVSFPEAEHHVAAVEVTFPNVPGATLQARMSRSSPGRYAVHEFAKNVFDVRAFDGKGKELTLARPNPYQWDVAGHDGTVRITYRIFGNLVDGTYLGIDTTHAHMNLPATLMWARQMDARPARVTFAPPPGSNWRPATQLFPTSDPWTFTAPNLQYLFDSPTELSAHTVREFTVANPDGKTFAIRAAIHTESAERDIDEYAAGVEKIVREAVTVFGEYPEFDTGSYTFLADYLPGNGGDGMEHRNSTVVSGRGSVRSGLGTASHEFFHAWNVERIRPQGLEPFNYEEANLTDLLWVAEGFTQYYGSLIMGRAGLADVRRTVAGMGSLAGAVINGPGRRFRSPVEMSHMAPFTDAARSVDPTNFGITFISYYTYGGAVALGLDLSLRDRTNGRVTLDDFMRAMWKAHGKPGGPQPGLVARPYTLADLRDRLAEVSGDRAFAEDFYRRYMVGREVVDYARLMQRAGVVLRKRNAGRGWAGDLRAGDAPNRLGNLQAPGTPAYEAGLEQNDTIVEADGQAVASIQQLTEAIAAKKPGDRIVIGFKRGSTSGTANVALREDPDLEAVLLEDAGGTPSADQKTFRDRWLGSQRR